MRIVLSLLYAVIYCIVSVKALNEGSEVNTGQRGREPYLSGKPQSDRLDRLPEEESPGEAADILGHPARTSEEEVLECKPITAFMKLTDDDMAAVIKLRLETAHQPGGRTQNELLAAFGAGDQDPDLSFASSSAKEINDIASSSLEQAWTTEPPSILRADEILREAIAPGQQQSAPSGTSRAAITDVPLPKEVSDALRRATKLTNTLSAAEKQLHTALSSGEAAASVGLSVVFAAELARAELVATLAEAKKLAVSKEAAHQWHFDLFHLIGGFQLSMRGKAGATGVLAAQVALRHYLNRTRPATGANTGEVSGLKEIETETRPRPTVDTATPTIHTSASETATTNDLIPGLETSAEDTLGLLQRSSHGRHRTPQQQLVKHLHRLAREVQESHAFVPMPSSIGFGACLGESAAAALLAHPSVVMLYDAKPLELDARPRLRHRDRVTRHAKGSDSFEAEPLVPDTPQDTPNSTSTPPTFVQVDANEPAPRSAFGYHLTWEDQDYAQRRPYISGRRLTSEDTGSGARWGSQTLVFICDQAVARHPSLFTRHKRDFTSYEKDIHGIFGGPPAPFSRLTRGRSLLFGGPGAADDPRGRQTHGTHVAVAAAGDGEQIVIPIELLNNGWAAGFMTAALVHHLSSMEWALEEIQGIVQQAIVARNRHSSEPVQVGTFVGVINFSMGGHRAVGHPAFAAFDLIGTQLLGLGVPIVVSAGNFVNDGRTYLPCGAATSICVAAADLDDRLAAYSGRGPAVAITAHGTNTNSGTFYDHAGHPRQYGNLLMSGTSMSAPVASKAVSLTGAAMPRIRSQDMTSVLQANALPSKLLPKAGEDYLPDGTPDHLVGIPETADDIKVLPGQMLPSRCPGRCPPENCNVPLGICDCGCFKHAAGGLCVLNAGEVGAGSTTRLGVAHPVAGGGVDLSSFCTAGDNVGIGAGVCNGFLFHFGAGIDQHTLNVVSASYNYPIFVPGEADEQQAEVTHAIEVDLRGLDRAYASADAAPGVVGFRPAVFRGKSTINLYDAAGAPLPAPLLAAKPGYGYSFYDGGGNYINLAVGAPTTLAAGITIRFCFTGDPVEAQHISVRIYDGCPDTHPQPDNLMLDAMLPKLACNSAELAAIPINVERGDKERMRGSTRHRGLPAMRAAVGAGGMHAPLHWAIRHPERAELHVKVQLQAADIDGELRVSDVFLLAASV